MLYRISHIVASGLVHSETFTDYDTAYAYFHLICKPDALFAVMLEFGNEQWVICNQYCRDVGELS